MDESAIQEAIDALDSHQFGSGRAAARHFDVKPDTLGRRMNSKLGHEYLVASWHDVVSTFPR
jgi:hypothetical protein